MLNQLSLQHIKNKKIKYLIYILAICFSLFVFLFSINKYYIEESNLEIDNMLKNYCETMNNKNFDEINKFLYPENNPENKEYINILKTKSSAIGLESIRLKKIYPALVEHNIAIVGFEVATNSNYNNQQITIKEIKTEVLLKKNNDWFIAKPVDLIDYDKSYLNILFNNYYKILKENISKDYDGEVYNSIAFNKIKFIGGNK